MITVFSFSVNLFVKSFVGVVVEIGNLVVVEVGIEVQSQIERKHGEPSNSPTGGNARTGYSPRQTAPQC